MVVLKTTDKQVQVKELHRLRLGIRIQRFQIQVRQQKSESQPIDTHLKNVFPTIGLILNQGVCFQCD